MSNNLFNVFEKQLGYKFMKPHKWHKEIKAWADGAIIECKRIIDPYGLGWSITNPTWDDDFEYRIKPQPKEPQYLYVIAFDKDMTGGRFSLKPTCNKKELVIGKIKLEQDDE